MGLSSSRDIQEQPHPRLLPTGGKPLSCGMSSPSLSTLEEGRIKETSAFSNVLSVEKLVFLLLLGFCICIICT